MKKIKDLLKEAVEVLRTYATYDKHARLADELDDVAKDFPTTLETFDALAEENKRLNNQLMDLVTKPEYERGYLDGSEACARHVLKRLQDGWPGTGRYSDPSMQQVQELCTAKDRRIKDLEGIVYSLETALQGMWLTDEKESA